MRYAEARGCAHRVRITAYTGCAAALIGGSTTTSLRGGGRYGKGSKAKLQEQFADAILLIVDEHSMLSLDETGRLLDAVRTGQSRDTPGGDLAMLFLGDFAQYPPVGCENLAFGSSYKDTEKGTAKEKVLAAFERIRKGKGKVGGNDRKAASMFEGWTFWRSMGTAWVLTEQFRAENDVEWNKLCKRRRCSYRMIPREQRAEQQAKDEKLLRGITLGAPDDFVVVELPVDVRDWGVEFEPGTVRVARTMDESAPGYGRVHVVEGSPAHERGVGSGWRPWVVEEIAGVAVSSLEGLETALSSVMIEGDRVEVKFRLLGRRIEDLDDAIGIFYHNDVVTQLGNAQGERRRGVAGVGLLEVHVHPPLTLLL